MSRITKKCCSVEELNKEFSKKISVVRGCLELRGMDTDDAESFKSLQIDIRDLRGKFKEIKDLIKVGWEDVAKLRNLLKKLEKLNQRVDHMEENFPDVLKPAVTEKLEKTQKEVTSGAAKPVVIKENPVVSKCNKTFTKMQLVTIQEFESVPKYMKGRFKYEQINKFVNEFNSSLEEKYKFLSIPRKELKPAQLKVWQNLKSQENAESKGLFFCTEADLKTYGNIKLDKAALNILTILRHCGKVKEIRGPGPIIRYTVV
ncbi:spindle and kinetochore-associated protein 1 [Trichonephila clavata]|uniref:SKA complex subunit 1 n=1 Tax=Trichonephila clavata TaxID=2740835 RepID=A0A8X6F5K7_TRICU|nr:spindle and kinetochore-associated protein 1 [Trichonephila clavata]